MAEAQWRTDLAREATDRCLGRALVVWATRSPGQRELVADLLLDARSLAIAPADAAVLSAREAGRSALPAAASGAAQEGVFERAIGARPARPPRARRVLWGHWGL